MEEIESVPLIFHEAEIERFKRTLKFVGGCAVVSTVALVAVVLKVII